ncbi:polymeric immunoglobulin receptor-like isoform X1 [Lates japonicus]|nr:polymeric immunoglobulin receptor-like isoform X1 [Lates japonicus]
MILWVEEFVSVTIRNLTQSDSDGTGVVWADSQFQSHTDFEIRVSDGYFLPLVLCMPLVFVLLAVSLLVFYLCKRKRNFEENSEENADYVNMEVPDNDYENWGPDSKCEDSVYQNFSPASGDQDQI